MRLLPAIGLLALGCPQPRQRPPSELSPTCADGFILDAGTCVPEACGVGTWGEIEVDDSAVYVDIGAAEGGDGSAEAPLTSIQTALDLAGSRGGGLVAAAAGSYPETLVLDSGHPSVVLAGRCRELVVLDASVGEEGTPGIDVDARYGEVELSGLSVVGAKDAGLQVGSGQVRLTRSRIEDNAVIGVLARQGGTGTSTILEIQDCEIAANTKMGVAASGTSVELTLLDSVVRDTRCDDSGIWGVGVGAQYGAVLRAEGCHIVDNRELGVSAMGSGAEVTLVDSSVQDTQPNDNGAFGYGIEVQSGATLQAKGCTLLRNTEFGLLASDAGSEVTLLDSLIRDSQTLADGGDGIGLMIAQGATLRAEGCELDRNSETGLLIRDAGTEVTLRHTIVRGTLPDGVGMYGHGIDIQGGATLWAEGCELAENSVAGLMLNEPGTQVTLLDSVVRDTVPYRGGELGYGIFAMGQASLTVVGCELVGNHGAGLLASERGTTVTVHDTRIVRTSTGWGSKSATAAGLAAQFGASITATAVLAQDNEGPGLYTVGTGTGAWLDCTGCSLLGNRFAGAVVIDEGTLELRSSTIADTLQSADLGGGVGVYATPVMDPLPPTLHISDSLIADNPTTGVLLSGEGAYQLSGVTITGSEGIAHGAGVRCGDGIYASGVSAWDGISGLLLEGSSLADNAGAGLFLDDAWAAIDGGSWSGNDPDLWVQGEACLSPRVEWSDVPNHEICPEWDRPTCAADFVLWLAIDEIDPGLPPPPTTTRPALGL